MLAYMFMHESCLLVCHPWFNTNEVMEIWSKPTFVPRGHHLLLVFLFACLFAILLVCLLACFLTSLYLCLPCLSRLSALCLLICTLYLFLPLLVCWLLVFAFACTHMELGHNLPSTSKKGANMSMWLSQAATISRFRSLVCIRYIMLCTIRPCSKDVGIYFPTLCACIVHDVCIYIPACPLSVDCHIPCHLRQAMPNFCRKSKVTCRRIFVVEIWHFS